MGLFSFFTGRNSQIEALQRQITDLEARSVDITQYNPSLHSQIYGLDTVNKIAVTERSSLQLSTVYACVKIISEAISSLPRNIHRSDDNGSSIVARKSYAQKVVTNPNPYMTGFVFEMAMGYCVELRGNGYAFIERDGNNRPYQLWPIHPDRVQPTIKEGRLLYEIDHGADVIEAADMLHFKGLTKDGLTGLSPIQIQAQMLSLGLSTQLSQKDFYEKGGNLEGVLVAPNKLDGPTREATVKAWNDRNSGQGKSRIALLDNGFVYHELGITPGDAKYLESKEAGAMEIARIYSVPLHLLQFQMNQTYASVEQLETAFVNHCLLPRVRMREEEIERKLLASYEVDTHYCKYNLNGLLRGDFKTRMEGYRILHSMGMPLNRILDLEDLNHVDGGDQSLAPLNMIPSDKLSEYHMTKPQGAAADSKRDLSVDELLDLKLKEQKND